MNRTVLSSDYVVTYLARPAVRSDLLTVYNIHRLIAAARSIHVDRP